MGAISEAIHGKLTAVALTPAGASERWKFPADGDKFKLAAIYATPILDGPRLIVIGFSGDVLALDPASGRPIIGWRFGEDRRWSFTINPILDNNYAGFSRLEFVPATRLDYKINDSWTVAAEEYDDFGELRGFLPSNQQSHQLWAVVDYGGDPISIEAGMGFGLTPATDNLAVKLMLISDLTGEHSLFRGLFK